jgi:hypothetical protein
LQHWVSRVFYREVLGLNSVGLWRQQGMAQLWA